MKNLNNEQMNVTKQDLYISAEQFMQYLNVQTFLGTFNMLSEKERDMTDLTNEEFKYIIKHYSYLKDLYINH